MGTAYLSQPSSDDQRRARKVRRFTIGVSLAMIILCNAIVLVGLWASGINLDELVATPDVFNSKQDICLRLGWQPVTGAADPVRSLLGVDQSIRSVRQDSSAATGDQVSARAGAGSIMSIRGSTPTIGYSYWCWLSWQSLRSGCWRNGIWSAGIGCVSNPPPAMGRHSSIELN